MIKKISEPNYTCLTCNNLMHIVKTLALPKLDRSEIVWSSLYLNYELKDQTVLEEIATVLLMYSKYKAMYYISVCIFTVENTRTTYSLQISCTTGYIKRSLVDLFHLRNKMLSKWFQSSNQTQVTHPPISVIGASSKMWK